MQKVRPTYKAAQEVLDAYVRTHDMRPSRVRNMVLEQVCLLKQPFTADQLAQACLAERITKGTVYNALKLFIEIDLLHATKRQCGLSATEYELTTANSNRLQIICVKCGRVADITDLAITRLVTERKYSNFNMQHFSLSVYGECKICRRKTIKRMLE